MPADHTGCHRIDELDLETPLILMPDTVVQIQLRIGSLENDHRSITIHSRPATGQPWRRHAQGTLGNTTGSPSAGAEPWPPADDLIDTTDLYDRFADHGYDYSPMFRGLHTVWRHGNAIHAEATLPPHSTEQTNDFGIHPALLDAALHALAAATPLGLGIVRKHATGQVWLPLSFTGIELHALGATTVRVVLAPTGKHTAAVTLFDPTGTPVASIDSLTLRRLPDLTALRNRASTLSPASRGPLPTEHRPRASAAVTSGTHYSTELPDEHHNWEDILTEQLGEVLKVPADQIVGSLPPWLDRLALPWHRRDARATARLHEVIYAAIDARRGSTTDHADLLTALLNARDPASNKPQLSDRQIVETILGLLLGGMDTTAAALSWTWFTLAEHPDIRRRVHAEIDGVLQGRHATYADLPRLELTARVVTEVLRIWPPSWLVTRVATMDTQLGEYSIPAGTNLVYSPYIIHHRADQYADPDLFDPDRWLPGHAIPRYAFLPFGAGGRKCIGETLATPDTILTLATIATRWRLERISDCRVRPKVGAFSGPRRLKMRVVARTSSA